MELTTTGGTTENNSEWNGMNRTDFNKQQQKETTKFNSIDRIKRIAEIKSQWMECKGSIEWINL